MTDSPSPGTDPTADWAPRGIDTRTPSTARMYDYYLGGKHHYPADREAAEQVLTAVPDLKITIIENRRFLGRAVRLMAQAGIRQFLDLGTGLPTQENVHQVAQTLHPDARVAYVDNDPVTLAHARALLANDTQTVVVDADLRRPEQVLSDPQINELIDFTQPVGVLLVAMLHFVTGDEDPAGMVATFRDAVPSGSYLALTHATAEDLPADTANQATRPYEHATASITLRTREQVHGLLTGFEVLDPGIVPIPQWRSGTPPPATTTPLGLAALARKP